MKQKIISCCNDCRNKRYKIIREVKGITICMGICPICKKNKPIIPAIDWEYMIGNTDELD